MVVGVVGSLVVLGWVGFVGISADSSPEGA